MPISRSASSSTWSPATALTGTTSRASTSLLAASVLVTTRTTGVDTSFSCRAM
jgi:hypothetical protein